MAGADSVAITGSEAGLNLGTKLLSDLVGSSAGDAETLRCGAAVAVVVVEPSAAEPRRELDMLCGAGAQLTPHTGRMPASQA